MKINLANPRILTYDLFFADQEFTAFAPSNESKIMATVTDSVAASARPSARLRGLDSIRFLCAWWVFCYHDVPPLQFNGPSALSTVLRSLSGNLWCGPAAVIVFFIISGFCIHLPYAGLQRQPILREFYTRRFLRLLPPMAVAILLGQVTGVSLTFLHVTVLWSLLAEFIYYLLYPALLALRVHWGGWRGLVFAAYVVAYCIIPTNPAAPDYPSFGPYLNWLVGLPCWLLGCWLAEAVNANRTAPPSTAKIWLWRGAILALGIVCSVLRFHASLGYPWTLNIFALPATCWLYREIAYHQFKSIPLLEWAGQWSYSLYLVHGPAVGLFLFMFSGPVYHPVLQWLALAGFVLGLSCLFYYIVERPSHIFARKAGRWALAKKPV